jgi:hypothetical protein
MKNIFSALAFVASIFLSAASAQAQTIPAPTEQQAEAIERLMAPQRAKVKAILDADKTGRYEAYQRDVKALFAEKDRAKRTTLEAQIKRTHYAFIKESFAKATIDLAELKRQIADLLGHSRFAMDEFGGISSQTSLPPGLSPVKTTATFECPLTQEQGESNCTLVSLDCFADVSDCSLEVSVSAVGAGGGRTKGSLGDKFELTGGSFSKMTVAAQTNPYYWGGVESLLLGYSQFNVRMGVRLQAPGLDKITITRDEWCIAPFLWFKIIEFNANDFLMQATFSGNFASGTTFTAQAYAEVFGLAVGVASGVGHCQLRSFDFVKATASN